MNSFGFILHHSWPGPEKSNIELFYGALKSRIALHRYHIQHTTDLYLKEVIHAKQELELQYAPNREANEKYKTLLGRFEDPQIDSQLAYDDSGLGNLESSHASQDYQLSEQHADLLELFNNSLVIQAYTVLEKGLKDLCDVLKIQTGEIISQNDFASSREYLAGYLKYLKLVIKLDVSKLDPFFNKIRDLQYVRNRLIHDRGEILKSEEKLAETLKKIKSVINASSGQVELIEEVDVYRIVIRDSKYVLDFYHIVLCFFQEILYLIEEKGGFKILENKLNRVMSSLQQPALLTMEKYIPARGSLNSEWNVHFINPVGLPDLLLSLKIAAPKTNNVYSVYQGPENNALSDLATNLKSHDFILINEFNDYFLIREQMSISLNLIAREPVATSAAAEA